MTINRIRWRLNEPTTSRQRWTRIHVIRLDDPHRAECGLAIPEEPYEEQSNTFIPVGWPVCAKCREIARGRA